MGQRRKKMIDQIIHMLTFLCSVDTHFSQWISHGNTRLTIRGYTAFLFKKIVNQGNQML